MRKTIQKERLLLLISGKAQGDVLGSETELVTRAPNSMESNDLSRHASKRKSRPEPTQRRITPRNPYITVITVNSASRAVAKEIAVVLCERTGFAVDPVLYWLSHWAAFEAKGQKKAVTVSKELGWEAGALQISATEAAAAGMSKDDCFDSEAVATKYLVPLVRPLERALRRKLSADRQVPGWLHSVLFALKLKHGVGNWGATLDHAVTMPRDLPLAVRLMTASKKLYLGSRRAENSVRVAGWCVGAPAFLVDATWHSGGGQ